MHWVSNERVCSMATAWGFLRFINLIKCTSKITLGHNLIDQYVGPSCFHKLGLSLIIDLQGWDNWRTVKCLAQGGSGGTFVFQVSIPNLIRLFHIWTDMFLGLITLISKGFQCCVLSLDIQIGVTELCATPVMGINAFSFSSRQALTTQSRFLKWCLWNRACIGVFLMSTWVWELRSGVCEGVVVVMCWWCGSVMRWHAYCVLWPRIGNVVTQRQALVSRRGGTRLPSH